MATANYINARSPYTRPQAVIWTKDLPLIDTTTGTLTVDGVEGTDFLILSDHNRSELSFSQQRIENKKNKVEDDEDDIDMHIDDFDNDKS